MQHLRNKTFLNFYLNISVNCQSAVTYRAHCRLPVVIERHSLHWHKYQSVRVTATDKWQLKIREAVTPTSYVPK